MRRIVLLSALILVGVGVAAGPRALAGSGSSGAAGPSVSITHFGAPVSGALGIVLGPDGALWFTNSGNDSIGRITTARQDQRLPGREHQRPEGDRAGAGRRALVHQQRQRLDRADHDRRQDQHLPGREHQRPGGDRARAGRRALVHQQRQRLDRADHDRRQDQQLPGREHQLPVGDRARAGRRALVHQPRQRLDRADHDRRQDQQLPGREHQQPVGDRARAGRRALVHQQRQRLDRADHDRRQDQQLPGREHQQPVGDRARAGRRLWFTNNGNDCDRADHDRAARSAPTGTRASATRGGSRSGRTAPSGSPTAATTRSGGSRPAARSAPHRDASISNPEGIVRGPDGALWFTNSGNDSIGRITTGGKITHLPGREHQQPVGDRARAGRRALVHQQRQRLDRADHDRRARSAPTAARASASRGGSRSGRTARSGSPTATTTRSGGSRPAARSPPTATRASSTRGGSRSGRTARSGSPTASRTRSGGSRPAARSAAYRRREHPRAVGDRARAGRRALVHQQRHRLDRADHDRRQDQQLPERERQLPVRDRARAGWSSLVHRPRQRLDRADHDRRARSAPTGTRASATRGGSCSGRTARSGSPTTATTRSGARRSSRATDDAARPPRRRHLDPIQRNLPLPLRIAPNWHALVPHDRWIHPMMRVLGAKNGEPRREKTQAYRHWHPRACPRRPRECWSVRGRKVAESRETSSCVPQRPPRCGVRPQLPLHPRGSGRPHRFSRQAGHSPISTRSSETGRRTLSRPTHRCARAEQRARVLPIGPRIGLPLCTRDRS